MNRLSSQSRSIRVLFVMLGDPHTAIESETVKRLRATGASCDQLVLPYGKRWKRLWQSFWAALCVRNYDVVITNEYNNAFIFTLVGKIYRKDIKNIAIGMNLSGRALKSGFGPIDDSINRVFCELSLIVVHSREEIDLFSLLHGISKDKFRFSSWGFDAPTSAEQTNDFRADSPPYFCMIGRNNRDFDTFLVALSESNSDGVIVCSENERLNIPPMTRVRVFRNLTMEECAACVRFSLANVVLVKDANRGAGHITAVMGMLFAKPHIFTIVPTLHDYLETDRHGFGVKLGDTAAVADAMTVLRNNSRRAAEFGKMAQFDAQNLHSHNAALERLLDILMEEVGLLRPAG